MRALMRWLIDAPGALGEAELRCRRLGRFYDKQIVPAAVRPFIEPGSELDRLIRGNARGYALRIAFFIENFSRMAGGENRREAALLCAIFAHIYDRCMDEGYLDPERLPRLIADLKDGFYDGHPRTEVRLMSHLYNEHVRRLLPEEKYALLYDAFAELHGCQVESLRQRRADTPVSEIVRITSQKGESSTLLICAISRPDLSPREQEVIRKTGIFFQYMDDFEDRSIDRRKGVRTPFTERAVNGRGLWRQLRSVDRELREVFQQHPRHTETFVQGLYSWFLLSFFERWTVVVGPCLKWIVRPLFGIANLLPNPAGK